MRKFFLLAVVTAFVWNSTPLEAAVIVKRIKQTIQTETGPKEVHVKPPKLLVHGIYSDNEQAWGTGRNFCYLKVLQKRAGYKLGDDLFLIGMSENSQRPKGFHDRGAKSIFDDMKQLDADLEYIMSRVPPEVAQVGGKQTYRDLGIKPDLIAHSKGGVVAELYSKNTQANRLIPSDFKAMYWNFSRGTPQMKEFKDIPAYKDNIGSIVELGSPVDGSIWASGIVKAAQEASKLGQKRTAKKILAKLTGQSTETIGAKHEHEGAQDLMRDGLPIDGGKVEVKDISDGKKVIKLEIKGLQEREPNPDVPIHRFFEDRIGGGDTIVLGSETKGGDSGPNGKNIKRQRVGSAFPVSHWGLTANYKTKQEVLSALGIKVPEDLVRVLTNPDDNEDLSTARYLPVSDLTQQVHELAKAKNLTWLLKFDEYWKLLYGIDGDKGGAQLTLEDMRRWNLKRELDWARDQVWREFEEAPDIAILENGHFEDTQVVVEGSGEPTVIVPIDFDPTIYEHKKVLIIPSGALQGYDASKFFKARLDEFVKKGGVLICFTQPYGYNYSALPPMEGLELGGYGYQQDQQCYYKGSYLDQLHPILKNQQDGQIDVYSDGYFTAWPAQAVTPIRRAKNDAPCVVVYPYGKGWVCATTLYMDWGFTHQQFSEDEKQLIKDLIAWAKAPDKELTEEEKAQLAFEPRQNEDVQMYITSDAEEYAQGAPALFTVHVVNKTDKDQTYTLYHAFPGSRRLRPGRAEFGQILRRDPLPPQASNSTQVYVPAGGQAEIQVAVPVVVSPETMWTYLYDAQGQYVATASRTFWIVSTNVQTKILTPPDLSQVKGSLPITVECRNPSVSFFGTVRVNLIMVDPASQNAFEESREIELDGKSTKVVTFNIPRTGKSGFYTLAAQIWRDAEQIGLGSGYLHIAEPIFDVTEEIKEVTATKLKAEYRIRNVGALADAKGTLRVKFLDPSGAVLHQMEQVLATDTQTEFAVPLETALPGLGIGEYRLTREFVCGAKKIEATTVLPNQFLLSGAFDKASYDAKEPWRLTLELKNVGRFTAPVAILVKIPALHYQKIVEIASPAAGNDVVLEGIVPDDATSGLGAASLELQMAGAPVVAATFTVREPDLRWDLPLSEYKAGTSLSFSLANLGGISTRATGTISLEDLGGNVLAQQAMDVLLVPGQTIPAVLAIPIALKSGPYVIRAQVEDGVTQRTALLQRPVAIAGLEASVEAALANDSLDSGESLELDALLKSLGLGESFDGVLKAKVMRKGPSPPERWDIIGADVSVTGLAADGDDVWVSLVSSRSGYLLRYNRTKKKWKTFPLLPETAPAAGTYVHTILPRENYVWFMSFRAGVTRYDKKRAQWETFLGPQLSTNEILEMRFDGDDVWFRGARSLDRLHLPTKVWKNFRGGVEIPAFDFKSFDAKDGEVWLGTEKGIFRYNVLTNGWDRELPSEIILSVAVTPQDVWAGLDQLRFENGRFRARVGRYDRSQRTWSFYNNTYQEAGKTVPGNSALPNSQISHIRRDTDGEWVWFAGSSGTWGVSRYSPLQDKWENFPQVASPPHKLSTIDYWKIGEKYAVISARSLLAYDKQTGIWKVYDPDTGSPTGPFPILSMADSGPDVWIARFASASWRMTRLDLAANQWEAVRAGLAGTVHHPLPDADGDLWFWTAANASASDTNNNFGITHYNTRLDEWEHILAGPAGPLDNKFFSLWVDGKDIWAGHSNGISRYSKAENKWFRYYGTNRPGITEGQALPFAVNPINGIRFDSDFVWFFTGHGSKALYRYDKAHDAWKRYDIPLPECHLMCVANDAVWVGSVLRNFAARLDKQTEQFALESIDREADTKWIFSSLSHILATPQDVWFGLRGAKSANPSSIFRSKPDGQWAQYFSKDAGNPDISYNNVFQRGGEFLFQGTAGLLRLDAATEAWSVLHAKSGELLDDNIMGMGLHGSEIWLGTAKGINIWEPERNVWRTFPSNISGGSFQVNQFVFDPEPGVVWALSGGRDLLRFRLAQDNSKPLWAKEWDVRVGDGAPVHVSIPDFAAAGEYELVLELFTKDGQLLESESKPFSVKKGGMRVSVTTDKARYLAGETAQVEVQVTNASGESAGGVPVGIFYGGEELFFENADFLAGETRTSSALASVLKGKTLRVVAGDTAVERTLDVRQPGLDVSFSAPDVAGREAFPVEVVLSNTGDVELNLQVEITGFKDFGPVVLPQGGTLTLPASLQIASDADFDLVVTGDLFHTSRRSVLFGVKFDGKAEIPAKMMEGTITIPWTLENTGLVAGSASVRLTLTDKNGATVADQSKTVLLEKGQKVVESLSAALSPGDYHLNLVWDGGQAGYALAVAAKPALKLFVEDKGISSGKQTFWVRVENPSDEIAHITLRSAFSGRTGERTFAVSAGGSEVTEEVFSLGGLAPGDHPVSLELVQSGRIAATWNGKTTIPEGEVKILPPAALTLPMGTQGKAVFTIVNDTSREAVSPLVFELEGLTAETRNVLVAPYQTVTQEFAVDVPEDFPQANYTAHYSFRDTKGDVHVAIIGSKVEVAWRLDKPAYAAGDTAHLTITVTNKGQPWDLEALVRYKDHSETVAFALADSKQLQFAVPVQNPDGEKIFLSIHTAQGRSLYINRFDVTPSGESVEVALDKQNYEPGETVRVSVTPRVAGTIRLSSVGGFFVEQNISGPAVFEFEIPAQTVRQTYGVDYEFEGAGGTVPFNVGGNLIRIISGSLTRSGPDACTGQWKVLSDQPTPARFVLLLAGETVAEVVLLDKEITLTEGENNLEETIDCAGLQVGLSRVRAAMYIPGSDGSPAAVFEAGLDEGSTALLAAGADKTVYQPGEAIRIKVTSFGENPTPMKLFSQSGELLWSGIVEYHSVSETTLELSSLGIGEHTLNLQLGDGGEAGSVSSQTIRVVVAPPPAPPVALPDLPPSDPPSQPAPPPQAVVSPIPVASIPAAAAFAQTEVSSVAAGIPAAAGNVEIMPGAVALPAGGADMPVGTVEVSSDTDETAIQRKRANPAKLPIKNPSRSKATGNRLAAAKKRVQPMVLQIPPRIRPLRQAWTDRIAIKPESKILLQPEQPQSSSRPWKIAQITFLIVLVSGVGLVYRRARRARQKMREQSANRPHPASPSRDKTSLPLR